MYSDAHLHSTHSPWAVPPEGGLFLSCAASEKDWQPLLNDRNIVPFLGIHPEKIGPDWEETLEHLDELLPGRPKAGLGECGLDKRYYSRSSRTLQERVLQAHFDLACRHERPVVLHQVGASGALADFLTEMKPEVPVMIHGFHGSKEVLDRYIKLGLYISTGPGRHGESSDFAGLVRRIPLEKLLVETDWPYGGQGEGIPYSRFLEDVYLSVSGALGIDKTELAGIVKRNGEIFTH